MNGDIGSISHGTMNLEDLIPTFTDELERLDENGSYKDLIAHARGIDFSKEDDWDWADTTEELFDALNDFAPEGCYFGAHVGDGCDYGFWPCEE